MRVGGIALVAPLQLRGELVDAEAVALQVPPPHAHGRIGDQPDLQVRLGYDDSLLVAFADPPYGFDDWAGLLAAVAADFVVAESAAEVAAPDGPPRREPRLADRLDLISVERDDLTGFRRELHGKRFAVRAAGGS